MTIEEVMSRIQTRGHGFRTEWATDDELRAALLALVAQARDDALTECDEICAAQGAEWNSDAQVTNKNYADHCALLIRARIAARAEGGA